MHADKVQTILRCTGSCNIPIKFNHQTISQPFKWESWLIIDTHLWSYVKLPKLWCLEVNVTLMWRFVWVAYLAAVDKGPAPLQNRTMKSTSAPNFCSRLLEGDHFHWEKNAKIMKRLLIVRCSWILAKQKVKICLQRNNRRVRLWRRAHTVDRIKDLQSRLHVLHTMQIWLLSVVNFVYFVIRTSKMIYEVWRQYRRARLLLGTNVFVPYSRWMNASWVYNISSLLLFSTVATASLDR